MELQLRRYKADVEEVHSGDDLVMLVDLGVDGLLKRVRARLYGVDTPDAYKLDSNTEAGKVRDQVRKLTKGKRCEIDLHSDRKGGWIVTLYVRETPKELFNINDHLISLGFVYKQDNVQ